MLLTQTIQRNKLSIKIDNYTQNDISEIINGKDIKKKKNTFEGGYNQIIIHFLYWRNLKHFVKENIKYILKIFFF